MAVAIAYEICAAARRILLRQVKAANDFSKEIQHSAAASERGGERIVPYSSNADLPASVRGHLPPDAQDIYREAFNAAWKTYGHDPRHEEIAHRIAWAAVKRLFHKGRDGQWEPNGRSGRQARAVRRFA